MALIPEWAAESLGFLLLCGPSSSYVVACLPLAEARLKATVPPGSDDAVEKAVGRGSVVAMDGVLAYTFPPPPVLGTAHERR
jgi:hypothetical protein